MTALLGSRAWRRLHAELDGDTVLLIRFLRSATDLLLVRAGRVRLAAEAGDADGLHEALLSLRSSADMTGAARIVEAVGRVDDALGSGPATSAALADLLGVVVRTDGVARRAWARHDRGSVPGAANR